MRPGGGAVRTPAQREEETFGFGMPQKTFAQPTAPVQQTTPTFGGYSQFPTQEPPEGYRWKFSAGAGIAGEYVVEPIPGISLTAAQKKQAEIAAKERSIEERRYQEGIEREQVASREAAEWKQTQLEWQQQQVEWEMKNQKEQWQFQQQQQQARLQAEERQWEQQLQFQEQQFSWQQEQAQIEQETQQRNYLAGLAAKPRSWLEYSAAAEETPAIQPWMLPLQSGDYEQQWTAGQAIPGYSAESMESMPELTTPSAQLYSRMGPTAQQQFLGYRQARTGIRPEEQEFRLWGSAPPAGRQGGLRYGR